MSEKFIDLGIDYISSGYVSRTDTTFSNGFRLMRNMRINSNGGIGNRLGAYLYKDEVDPDNNFDGFYSYRKPTIAQSILMAASGGSLYANSNYDDNWYKLADGYTTGSVFGFNEHYNTNELQDFIYFGNRSENYARWDGIELQVDGDHLATDTSINVDSVLYTDVLADETATSSSETYLRCSALNKAWAGSQWVGFYVYIKSGTYDGYIRKIISNDDSSVQFKSLPGDPGHCDFEIRIAKLSDSGTLSLDGTMIKYPQLGKHNEIELTQPTNIDHYTANSYGLIDVERDKFNGAYYTRRTNPASSNNDKEYARSYGFVMTGSDDDTGYIVETLYEVDTSGTFSEYTSPTYHITKVTFGVAGDMGTVHEADVSVELAYNKAGEDMKFNSDGTSVYFYNRGAQVIYQHGLSTAYDITTMSYVNSFNISSVIGTAGGFDLSDDDEYLYVSGMEVGYGNYMIKEYSMTTPGTINTASATGNEYILEGDTFDIHHNRLRTIESLSLASNNKDLYLTVDRRAYKISMGTAKDLSTASYNNEFIDLHSGLVGEPIGRDGNNNWLFIDKNNNDAMTNFTFRQYDENWFSHLPTGHYPRWMFIRIDQPETQPSGQIGTTISDGDILVSAVKEYPGAPKGNLLENLYTQMYVGNVLNGLKRNDNEGGTLMGDFARPSVYRSNLRDATDFTFGSPRGAGEGDINMFPSNGMIKDIKELEDSMFVFLERGIYRLSYGSNETDIPKIDNISSGIGIQGLTYKGGNDVYFVNNYNQFSSVGRVSTKDARPQTQDIGFHIERLLNKLYFDKARGVKHKYRHYLAARDKEDLNFNNVILPFNYSIMRDGKPISEGVWDTSCFDFVKHIDDNSEEKLLIADDSNSKIYELNRGIGKYESDSLTFPYTCEALTNWVLPGESMTQSIEVSALAIEGYMTIGSEVEFSLYKDFNDESPVASFSLEGYEDDYIDSESLGYSLGLTPLGTTALGVGSEPIGTFFVELDEEGRRHFKVIYYFPSTHGSAFSFGIKSTSEDNFNIIRMSINPVKDQSIQTNRIKLNS